MPQIGSVHLSNRLILAPMAGVTDLAFRQVCREHGAGLTVTEMVSTKALDFGDKKTPRLMQLGADFTAILMGCFRQFLIKSKTAFCIKVIAKGHGQNRHITDDDHAAAAGSNLFDSLQISIIGHSQCGRGENDAVFQSYIP